MNNEHPKRRLVAVSMDNAITDSIFRNGYIPPLVVEGVPKDAVMIGSTFDLVTNHTRIIYQHDSFAEVEPGEMIPDFYPLLRTMPRIVCLCGSTRFYDAYQEAYYRETLAGKIVLSVGFAPQSQTHGEEIGCTPEQKKGLDELHLRKIDIADEVLFLNVGGYMGESTRRELEYARKAGKMICFLEPPRVDEELLDCDKNENPYLKQGWFEVNESGGVFYP